MNVSLLGENAKPRLSVQVTKVAHDLEHIAVLIRAEVMDFNRDGNAERLSRLLDRSQLRLSEVVVTLSIARAGTDATSFDRRSSRIKSGMKAALERRWREWGEVVHEQSAAERFHTFIEPGGKV